MATFIGYHHWRPASDTSTTSLWGATTGQRSEARPSCPRKNALQTPDMTIQPKGALLCGEYPNFLGQLGQLSRDPRSVFREHRCSPVIDLIVENWAARRRLPFLSSSSTPQPPAVVRHLKLDHTTCRRLNIQSIKSTPPVSNYIWENFL